MSLALQLEYDFNDGPKIRGEALYAAGAVRWIESSGRHAVAEVRGGSQYSVRMSLEGDDLWTWCDCPYFDENGPCKHLWAAVLEADRRGALADAAKVKHLTLEEDFPDPDLGALDLLRQPSRIAPHAFTPAPCIPPWQEYLDAIHRELPDKPQSSQTPAKPSRVLYVIDLVSSRNSGKISIELLTQTRLKNGNWSVPKAFHATSEQAAALPDPVDEEAVSALLGATEELPLYGFSYAPSQRNLPRRLAGKLLPTAAAAGRLYYRDGLSGSLHPTVWDEGEPWQLWLEIRQDDRDQWTIAGTLRRGEERMPVSEPLLILKQGFLLARDRVSRFDPAGNFPWIAELRSVERIPFPDRERDRVLEHLLSFRFVPPMELDPPLQFEEVHTQPRLALRIRQQREGLQAAGYSAQLLFDYGQGWTEGDPDSRGRWFAEQRVYLLRDAEAEQAAAQTLRDLGLRHQPHEAGSWSLSARTLPRALRRLIQAGWHVEAEGKVFRAPGPARFDVRSGIDWFELYAQVDYGETSAGLPQLLAAARRGDSMVVLGDGTFGLLPEKWLARFAPLASLGSKEADHLRFRHSQAGLLDALLLAQPDVRVDEVFARARERMRGFQGIEALPQPEGFVGQLRDYQREGLGWMAFLREFSFGGCLADDMGVGKTAQVLAVLESRRAKGYGPSLVVVPKSVMFNWRQEAARFTPQLRVLEYIGAGRGDAQIDGCNLMLTTYGTLLRDAPKLAKVEFDYVVLDEAQAVKNASTASAKAVRLLRGKHRLALSGTPVENHLGELWSLFEFLNPGMLGEAKLLKMAGGLARNPSEETRKLLAQALRPFILRRTKQQVTRELPEKTEQTIFCELEGAQKKQYNELRNHFRLKLLQHVEREGLGRSKMHVLEALLRLRQAACHPGLLDARRVDEPSAKLDLLMERLADVLEEGHKALVFSQFTSLLAIVRRRLDQENVRYEYLDGATTNREQHVGTFQNDPSCGLFLISLKAGGLGLNLTAAEYVFLLDPWWNPAVEAQAVDRAHRIGQTHAVFAYRLIARDTVEEKVLELQKTKRDLADAILGEDRSLIRDLKREDLELLLS